MKFIPKITKKGIMAAENTAGMDEASVFAMRIKNNPKSVPSKAIFGKKHINFHHKLLKWDQTYKKLKGGPYI